MGSLAVAGKTAVLQVAGEIPPIAPVTWVDMVEVTEIGNFNVDRALYDVTFHSSSDHSDQIVGRRLPVLLDFEANFVYTEYVSAYWDKFINKELSWYRILPPDGELVGHGFWLFEAYMKALVVVTPLDGAIKIDGTLAITQDYTFEEIT